MLRHVRSGALLLVLGVHLPVPRGGDSADYEAEGDPAPAAEGVSGGEKDHLAREPHPSAVAQLQLSEALCVRHC